MFRVLNEYDVGKATIQVTCGKDADLAKVPDKLVVAPGVTVRRKDDGVTIAIEFGAALVESCDVTVG